VLVSIAVKDFGAIPVEIQGINQNQDKIADNITNVSGRKTDCSAR
jgi:hypothetical protein